MESAQLDDMSSDRLLSGALDPDDAPPGYGGVAALLQAAAASSEARPARARGADARLADGNPSTPSAKEQRQIAAMVAAIVAGSVAEGAEVKPKRKRSPFKRARLGALVVAGMLFASTGLALAGALPTALQNAASTVLSKVGISVPHSHPTSLTTSTTTPLPPSNGPDANGAAKFGLCNAFSSGQGGTNGNKNNSVAFQNLQKAAQAAGQSVDEFCKSAMPGGKTGGGKSRNGTAHGHRGRHTGQHGQSGMPPQGQGHGPGKAKGSGGS